MTTIIGFIPPDGICQGAEVTLPVGFLATGECIEFSDKRFADCKLIFLDDTCSYNIGPRWGCFQGNERDALLFQHNSNRDSWADQIEWLESHGWKPRRFGSFSRTEEGAFMKATKTLLCNGDNCHAEVIQDLLQRVEGKYLFKLLDTYVAWEILCLINDDDDTSDQRDKAFDLLPNDLREKLPECPLTSIISTANEQAFDRLQ